MNRSATSTPTLKSWGSRLRNWIKKTSKKTKESPTSRVKSASTQTTTRLMSKSSLTNTRRTRTSWSSNRSSNCKGSKLRLNNSALNQREQSSRHSTKSIPSLLWNLQMRSEQLGKWRWRNMKSYSWNMISTFAIGKNIWRNMEIFKTITAKIIGRKLGLTSSYMVRKRVERSTVVESIRWRDLSNLTPTNSILTRNMPLSA